MTLGHFLHLVLGMAVGFIPTAIRIINRKLDTLDKKDPVTDSIMEEAIRKLSEKKPLMKQNETVVNMTESSCTEKPSNSKTEA